MHWEVSDEEIDWFVASTAVVADAVVDGAFADCVDVLMTDSSLLIGVTWWKFKINYQKT